MKKDFWFGCILSRSSQNSQGNFFLHDLFLRCCPLSCTPSHAVETKEIQQPLVHTICACPLILPALTPGLSNSWQLNFSLILRVPCSWINSCFHVKSKQARLLRKVTLDMDLIVFSSTTSHQRNNIWITLLTK